MPVATTESIVPSSLSAAFGCGLTGCLAERAEIQVGHLYRSAHFRDLIAYPRFPVLPGGFILSFRGYFFVASTQNGAFLVPFGLKIVTGIIPILAENLLLFISRSGREKRGFTATP